MNLRKTWNYLIHNLREKHRFSLRNQHTDSEVWHMHISPLNLVAGFFGLVLILFVLITLAVAYTPILDLIPGYPGNKSRLMLVNGVMRLDSLERELKNMELYSENIALIMAGKNPVTRNEVRATDSLSKSKVATISRIPEDSLLRLQLEEKKGAYSLDNPDEARKNLRMALELYAPVKGVVTTTFDPQGGHYGLEIVTTVNQPVMSVMEGTVISSSWNPQDGYAIYIQHADNLVSVYRHNVSILKKEGDRVQGGEVIGYTGSEEKGGTATGNNPFMIELWHKGTPVDPQGYIVF